jgi:hypothetical protein
MFLGIGRFIPDPADKVAFAVGDKVEKTHGYSWPGEVRAVFTTLAGHTRLVVECTVSEVSGALHIYSPEQLRKV